MIFIKIHGITLRKKLLGPLSLKKLSIKEADRAHNIMEKNENIGKIILEVY